VKAIDLQSQSVLTEYNDSNTMTVNYIWFPVECLTPCLLQIPPKSYSFLPESQAIKIENVLNNTIVSYSRQTLMQFFMSIQNEKKRGDAMLFRLPSENMKLHDVISWGVWELFGQKPIIGWMKEAKSSLLVQES
jgi:hypothetical protein